MVGGRCGSQQPLYGVRLNTNTNADDSNTNTNNNETFKEGCHSAVVGGGCGASVGLT